MIRISQLKLPLDHTETMLEEKICQKLKIKREDLISWEIHRRSVDARKKPELFFVYNLDLKKTKDRKIEKSLKKINDKNIM